MDPITAWREEHAHFNRLLGELQRELDAFNAGERPDYELMLDIIAYLREHSDRHHHPREDAAFARLAQRCPELALPVARLAQEHRVIAHAGETLRAHLQAVIDGALLPREQVEVAAATYLVYYISHIAREEEQILPRAAEALTPEDWKAVSEAAPTPRPLA